MGGPGHNRGAVRVAYRPRTAKGKTVAGQGSRTQHCGPIYICTSTFTCGAPCAPCSSAPALRGSTGRCTVHLPRAPTAAAACEPMDACILLQQPCTFSIETCLPTHQKLLATRPAGLPTSNLQTDLHDAGPTDKPHFKFPFQISQFPSRWQ